MPRRGRKRKTIEPDFVNIDDNTCSICYAEFLDYEDLRVHFAQTHPDSAAARKCKFCPTTTPDIEKYLSHILDNHIETLKVCNFCLRCFVNEAEYESHAAKHVCDTSGRYPCSQCNVYFQSMKELQSHESSHISDDGEVLLPYFSHLTSLVCMDARSFLTNFNMGTLTCLKCHFTTNKVEKYLSHLNKNKCKLLVCEKCNQGFESKIGLITHVKACEDLLKSVAKCINCGKKVRKSAYKTHRKLCVNNHCQTCDLDFDTIAAYTSHQMTHNLATNMVLRFCRFCSLEVIGDRAYVKHMLKTHSDYHLYKYKCVRCNKIFKHPKYLFSHYNSRYHKYMEPYSCKICDKTFRSRKQFTVHIKLAHTSLGFVEFDDNFLVNFVQTRSEKPFRPTANTELFTEKESEELAVLIEEHNLAQKAFDKKKTAKKKTARISSDDKSLSNMKRKKKKAQSSVAKLTCTLCKQRFMNKQQYYKHLSGHFISKTNKCYKCSLVFSSAKALVDHKRKCASSGISSRLRLLLEKRKSGDRERTQIPDRDRFRATVKQVVIPPNETVASIVAAENKQSAKDFLENFTPDESRSSVVIKRVAKPIEIIPMIKMTKFTPVEYSTQARLKKPVKFKDDTSVRVKTIIRLHQNGSRFVPKMSFNSTPTQDVYTPVVDPESFDMPAIPEVAEEIQLEHTQDKPKYLDFAKSVENYPNLLEVAHLQDEAPYYKIVPVKPKISVIEEPLARDIHLPSGAKLVNINPLAHLMNDKTLEELTKNKRKSKYKPRLNPTEALQKALMTFNSIPMRKEYKRPKRRREKRRVVVDEED